MTSIHTERLPVGAESEIPALDVATTLSTVRFDATLESPSLDDLRGVLTELYEADPVASRAVLYVDTVPKAGGIALAATDSAASSLHLFFDLHRIFIYRHDGDPSRLESLLHFLRDGYPIQPLKRLERHVEQHGYRFLYSTDVLHLLPFVWAELQDGEMAELDLISGAVRRAPVLLHPALSRHREPRHREAAAAELQDRMVDASLRGGLPEGLDRLVGGAGLVHRHFTVRDRLSLPFSTAETRWSEGRHRESCFGKSRRHDRAETVAACEALERYQVAVKPAAAELVHGSFDELQHRALDPRTLFLGREPDNAASRLPVFDPDARLYWTPASPVGGGEPLWVPAQEVWFQTTRLAGETRLARATTNGCALGSSLEEAGLFGVLEAVERDAFLTTWYLRRRPRLIDPDSVEDAGFQTFRHRWQLAYPAYDFRLFDITTDMALPVVLAVALRREDASDRQENLGPRVFFAAACRLRVEDSCASAMEDLAGFDPELSPERRESFRRLLEDPRSMDGPAEHFQLYALDEAFDRLSFLELERSAPEIDVATLRAASLIEPASTYNLKQLLQDIDDHSRSLGVSLYLKDISHPAAAELGLACAKAVTPGLFPIWFGAGNQRFRRTRRLRSLAESWFDDPAVAEARLRDVNLGLHPFS